MICRNDGGSINRRTNDHITTSNRTGNKGIAKGAITIVHRGSKGTWSRTTGANNLHPAGIQSVVGYITIVELIAILVNQRQLQCRTGHTICHQDIRCRCHKRRCRCREVCPNVQCHRGSGLSTVRIQGNSDCRVHPHIRCSVLNCCLRITSRWDWIDRERSMS